MLSSTAVRYLSFPSQSIFLVALFIAFSISADIRQQSFSVNTTITPGCILGTGSTDTSNFGNINFGNNIATLFSNVDITSTQNAGSIVLKCTPGLNATLSIDSGLYSGGSITNGRFMKLTSGTSTLKYQLYQNVNHTTIWGNGSNGGPTLGVSANGTVQQFDIYARLFSTTVLPAVGQYSDTVLVTVSY
ncbi:spore coat protein U [Pragia fontium]|uniref:Spore coat protein U n=1 Tax=Pragia fontium TaxID=82985 RepID=A0ABQ5LFC4_9GAMM|nr:spore coat U domain-containing protein [Pragia fontium]GKX62312.1 spore coat protein U [Pragia fontium]